MKKKKHKDRVKLIYKQVISVENNSNKVIEVLVTEQLLLKCP